MAARTSRRRWWRAWWRRCGGVAACCVVGAPDADLGEVPVVFATRAAGAPPTDEAGIRAAVLAGLGRIYVPRDVLWVDALPENAVGRWIARRWRQGGGRLSPPRPADAGTLNPAPRTPSPVAPQPCIQPAPGH